MKTTEIHFSSIAQKIALTAERAPLGAITGRVTAVALYSLSGAIDFVFHTIMVLPTFIYAVGKSIISCQADFSLPWDHLKRVRAAVGPILFGSIFGLFHPAMGALMGDTTEKHTAAGILSSNLGELFPTPCSPVDSFEAIADVARSLPEHYSKEDVSLIEDVIGYEKTLNRLHAQEFVQKLTNTTLLGVGSLRQLILSNNLPEWLQETLIRFSGVTIPLLTVIDLVAAVALQTFFLLSGLLRVVTGYSPLYTERSFNPLLQGTFLFQTIFKAIGNLLATPIWMIHPMAAYEISLFVPQKLFALQKNLFANGVEDRIRRLENGEKFLFPFIYNTCDDYPHTPPIVSSHQTFVLVEKKEDKYHFTHVNRALFITPRACTYSYSLEEACRKIRKLITMRFPYMDPKKNDQLPKRYDKLSQKNRITSSSDEQLIASQGNFTNCIISSLFGVFDFMKKPSEERNLATRQAVAKKFALYRHDAYPFNESLSMSQIFENGEKSSAAI